MLCKQLYPGQEALYYYEELVPLSIHTNMKDAKEAIKTFFLMGPYPKLDKDHHSVPKSEWTIMGYLADNTSIWVMPLNPAINENTVKHMPMSTILEHHRMSDFAMDVLDERFRTKEDNSVMRDK